MKVACSGLLVLYRIQLFMHSTKLHVCTPFNKVIIIIIIPVIIIVVVVAVAAAAAAAAAVAVAAAVGALVVAV